MSLSITEAQLEQWIRDNPDIISEVSILYETEQEQQAAIQAAAESDIRRQTAKNKITSWEPDLAYNDNDTPAQKRQKAYLNIKFLKNKKPQAESSEELDEINKRIKLEESLAKQHKIQQKDGE